MQINCRSCGKANEFLLPLWVRTTFKFNEDGSLSILHVKPLEYLEEKLTDNQVHNELVCKSCSSNDVEIIFNEYEESDKTNRELAALEGL